MLLSLEPNTRSGFVALVQDFLEKLKEIFAGRPELTQIELLEKEFLEVAKKVEKINAVEQQKNTTEDGGGVKYSLITEFKQQVDNVLNNKYDKNNHVYMGNTPQRLVRILGIPSRPMLVTNNHVYSMSVSEQHARSEGRYNKNFNYHDLGSIVKELPRLLDQPIMIIKSNTKSDDATFVVVTSAVDKQGAPVIVAVKPNGKGFYYNVELESTAVLSAYGKDEFFNYVNTARNQGRILYANKSSQRTNIPGVQFPNNILSADYSNNLARFKQIVNSNSMQSGKKYSYASEKSSTANKEKLEEAKRREKSRNKIESDMENIRRELGWFRGIDRMWRR